MEVPKWLLTENVRLPEFAAVLAGTGAPQAKVDAWAARLRMEQRRKSAFPKNRSPERSPAFAVGELLAWADAKGHQTSVSAVWILQRTLDIAVREAGRASVRAFAAAAVALRAPHLQGTIEDNQLARLQSDSKLAKALGLRVTEAIDATLQSGASHAEVFEVVLADATPSTTRGASTSTGAPLVELLIAVASPRSGELVLDPAMGEAGLLVAAAVRAPGVRLAGRELDPITWHIAAARLRSHGLVADIGDGPSDGLAMVDVEAADVVIIDPPAQDRTVEQWLTTARDHLRPGGSAVVVLPKRAIRRRPTRELPEWDAISTVILAPHRLRPDLSEQIAIVVMTPGGRRDDTLLLDASRFNDQSKTLEEIIAAIAPDIGRTLRAWRRSSATPAGTFPVANVARRQVRNGGILEYLQGEEPKTTEAKRQAHALATQLQALLETSLPEIYKAEYQRTLNRIIDKTNPEGGVPTS